MLTKLILFCQIKRFYNIFGDVIGERFIANLSEMTNDNLYDVLFDLNEALEMYDEVADSMCTWLEKLYCKIERRCA